MYCAKADILARFSEIEIINLTDSAGLNVIDDAVLDQAIADATGDIDSYLTGRYALPIAVPPADIVHKACDLTRFYLYSNRDGVTEQVQKRYDAIIRFFEQVAKGTIKLSLDVPVETATTNDIAITSNTAVFKRA